MRRAMRVFMHDYALRALPMLLGAAMVGIFQSATRMGS